MPQNFAAKITSQIYKRGGSRQSSAALPKKRIAFPGTERTSKGAAQKHVPKTTNSILDALPGRNLGNLLNGLRVDYSTEQGRRYVSGVRRQIRDERAARLAKPGTLESAMATIDEKLGDRVSVDQRKTIKGYLTALGGATGVTENHLELALKMAGQGHFGYMARKAQQSRSADKSLAELLEFSPQALTEAFDHGMPIVKTKAGGRISFDNARTRWLEAGGTPEIGSGRDYLDNSEIYYTAFGAIPMREENMRRTGRPYRAAKEDNPDYGQPVTRNWPSKLLRSVLQHSIAKSDPDVRREVIEQELQSDLVRGADDIHNSVRFFVPGLSQLSILEEGSLLLDSMNEIGIGSTTAEFIKGTLESVNIFDPAIGPAQRVARGVNAVLMALGVGAGARATWARGSKFGAAQHLAKKLQISEREALHKLLEWESYAKRYISQQERLIRSGKRQTHTRIGNKLVSFLPNRNPPGNSIARETNPKVTDSSWIRDRLGTSEHRKQRPSPAQKTGVKQRRSLAAKSAPRLTLGRGVTPVDKDIESIGRQIVDHANRSGKSPWDFVRDIPEPLQGRVSNYISEIQSRRSPTDARSLKHVMVAELGDLLGTKKTKIGFTIADKAVFGMVTLPSGARFRMHGGPGYRLKGTDPHAGDGLAWSSSTLPRAQAHHGVARLGAPTQLTISNAVENVFASHVVPAVRAEIAHAVAVRSVSPGDILSHARHTVAKYNSTKIAVRKKLPIPGSTQEFLASLDLLDDFEVRAAFGKMFWSAPSRGRRPTNPFGASWTEVSKAMNEPTLADRGPGDVLGVLAVDPRGKSRMGTGHPIYPHGVIGENLGVSRGGDVSILLAGPLDKARESFANQKRPVLVPSEAQIRNRLRTWLMYGHREHVPAGVLEVDTDHLVEFLTGNQRRIAQLESALASSRIRGKQSGMLSATMVELASRSAIRLTFDSGLSMSKALERSFKQFRMTSEEALLASLFVQAMARSYHAGSRYRVRRPREFSRMGGRRVAR